MFNPYKKEIKNMSVTQEDYFHILPFQTFVAQWNEVTAMKLNLFRVILHGMTAKVLDRGFKVSELEH